MLCINPACTSGTLTPLSTRYDRGRINIGDGTGVWPDYVPLRIARYVDSR